MKPTVLVIDDFASVRLYHMSFLTRKGYRCLGAASGTEALALLAQETVDLVLLDLVMPGMPGDVFEAQLAADPRHAHVPVLVVSSEEALARTAFANARRPIGIVAKPVMPTPLLRQVHQLLGQPASVA